MTRNKNNKAYLPPELNTLEWYEDVLVISNGDNDVGWGSGGGLGDGTGDNDVNWN